MLLGAYGGLRFSEIAGLRRKRLDVLRGRVTVAETLSDVNGVLTRANEDEAHATRCLCRARSAQARGPPRQLRGPGRGRSGITGSKGGPCVEPGSALLLATSRRCGVGRAQFSRARHTFASLCRDAGADVLEISCPAIRV